MHPALQDILDGLAPCRERVSEVREILLANLVMLGEIPSPTFGEQERVQFLSQRFTEGGLSDISIDEVDNCAAVYGGRNGERHILVVAHTDTVHQADEDHTVQILPDRVRGLGLCDNGLGVAVLATLPHLLEALDLQLDANLVLLGSSRSLGRGNLEGLRFFLQNNRLPLDAAVCVEGVQLGRLSLESIGMLRGEIVCRVPDSYDWTRFGATGAITALNEVINRIVEIPIPRRPRTSIVFGSVRGGASFNTVATEAMLRFEIRSESAEEVMAIRERVEVAVTEVASRTGAEIELDLFASRQPGGIDLQHPLAAATREIMKHLGVEMRLSPSTSELAELIEHQLPAVTIGITEGVGYGTPGEHVLLEPLATGLAQLIGVLQAVDRGGCDVD